MINTKGFAELNNKIKKKELRVAKRKKSFQRAKVQLQKQETKSVKYQLNVIKKNFAVKDLHQLMTAINNLAQDNQNKANQINQLKAQLAQSQQNQQQPQPQQSKQSSF